MIENVTTNKVNVTDIVDNLTSTATNKPLSAKQGKILNNLISTLTETVNTKIDTINGDSFIATSKSGTTAAITHKDVSRTNTTSTTSPTSGGTFTAVKSVASDSKGHVIGIDTETITLPNTAVTVDSELSSTSTNPIQNKVLVNALNEKSDTNHDHDDMYLKLTGNSMDNTVTFSSKDELYSDSWTNVEPLQSDERHYSIFNKISVMCKNVRYLYKLLGTTNISGIGNGTVTSAISTLNSNLGDKFNGFTKIVVKHGITETGASASFCLSRALFGIANNVTPTSVFVTIHNIKTISYYDYDASVQSLSEGYDYLWFRTDCNITLRYTILIFM